MRTKSVPGFCVVPQKKFQTESDFFPLFLLVSKRLLDQIVKLCQFENKDQSSFLLVFRPQYYQRRRLCTLSGVVSVRHSGPGRRMSLCFSDGTQKAASHQETSAGTPLRQASRATPPDVPLAQTREGRRGRASAGGSAWRRRCGCREGQISAGRRPEGRRRRGVSCYLLLRFCRTP